MSAARKTRLTTSTSSTTSTAKRPTPTSAGEPPAVHVPPPAPARRLAVQVPTPHQTPPGAAALQASLAPVPPTARRRVGRRAGAHRPRTGPAKPRPPLLLARSCALTALLPPALHQLLKAEIGQKLERHFQAPQWNYPIWLFRDSEILWGERAQMLHAGRALRGLPLKGPPGKDYGLLWLLLYDAERLARLVVERHPEHTLHERVVAILGALRRIGQVFREMRWRYGERQALWHVRAALGCLLWW